MKKKLKLLCSYEEYINPTSNRLGISEETAELLALSYNLHRTNEEEIKYQQLLEKSKDNCDNHKYTEYVHKITKMYNSLKYIHDEEERTEVYIEIGKKQCQIEILKESLPKG